MWDKLFTSSLVAVTVGIATLLVTKAAFDPPEVVLLIAALLVGVGGFFAGISGIALILTANARRES